MAINTTNIINNRRNVRVCLCITAIVSFTALSFYPSTKSIQTLQEYLLVNLTVGGGSVLPELVKVPVSSSSSSSIIIINEQTTPKNRQGKNEYGEDEKVDSWSNQTMTTTMLSSRRTIITKQHKNYSDVRPLNIIILYPDDMRHDSLSSVGKQPVFTPRLDDLARNGIRFAHNCVTTSICWISRATMFTGQYGSRHQSFKLYKTIFYDHWNESWPYLLQQHQDYFVGHIGKWQYHRQEFVPRVYNWTRLFEGQHYHSLPNQGGRQWVHTTDYTLNSTIDFLRERPIDKNFALTVAFYPPKALGGESPFNPKPESASLYENITIPPPVEDPEIGWSHLNRTVFSNMNHARKTYYSTFDTPEKYQKNMKAMYRMIHEVDAACGSIMDELEHQGLLNTTMVIFTADNGFLQGEHGLVGKWFPYEESIRVPLIVYDPRMPTMHRGTVRDEFTLNVDLAETILGAAGIDPPKGMQGRDIAELYLHNVDDWRQEFYYEHPTHLAENAIPQSSAIVRKDLKYMTWDNLGVESLYDLEKDPNELHNVIEDPSYSKVLKELKQRYQELKQKVEEPYYP